MPKTIAELPIEDQHLLATVLAVGELVEGLTAAEVDALVDSGGTDPEVLPVLLTPDMRRHLIIMAGILAEERESAERRLRVHRQEDHRCPHCGASVSAWGVRWDAEEDVYAIRCDCGNSIV